jgi:hypothetical protein
MLNASTLAFLILEMVIRNHPLPLDWGEPTCRLIDGPNLQISPIANFTCTKPYEPTNSFFQKEPGLTVHQLLLQLVQVNLGE